MRPASRTSPRRLSSLPAAALCLAIVASAPRFSSAPQSAAHAAKPKLPKPQQLDKRLAWHRDPSTGELVAIPDGAEAPSGAAAAPLLRGHALSVQTRLVPLTCAPVAENGDALLGLSSSDFHVYDDGVERPIVFFHPQSDLPAEVALVIDASPSVLPDSAEMAAAARAFAASLNPADEIAVVDFSEDTFLQLPLSKNRALLAAALARVNVPDLLGGAGGSNIYEAVYLAGKKLFANPVGRKAIVLLTDGQDSGLGLSLDPRRAAQQSPADAPDRLTFEDVIQSLAAQDVETFVVSTENRPKVMTPAWLFAHRDRSLLDRSLLSQGIPAYDIYLAELVRRTGGELYFLRDNPDMTGTFRRIAQRIRSEYWLGVSPAPASPADSAPHPGWHALRVEVSGPSQARVIHRAGYYVPPKS